ncbi:hypothetical protein HDV05_006973 [Chytridiales sp. JEL 0842]|nr:hypothetical protein HDV05_006973 [Chytridiales sp. JEL 0842]
MPGPLPQPNTQGGPQGGAVEYNPRPPTFHQQQMQQQQIMNGANGGMMNNMNGSQGPQRQNMMMMRPPPNFGGSGGYQHPPPVLDPGAAMYAVHPANGSSPQPGSSLSSSPMSPSLGMNSKELAYMYQQQHPGSPVHPASPHFQPHPTDISYTQPPTPPQYFSPYNSSASSPASSPSQNPELPPLSFFDFWFTYIHPPSLNNRQNQHQPPPPPDPATLRSTILSHLATARLSPKDARIQDSSPNSSFQMVGGGGVWLSPRGRRVLDNFLEMRVRSKAALVIQKVGRGYLARKRVQMLKNDIRERGGRPVSAMFGLESLSRPLAVAQTQSASSVSSGKSGGQVAAPELTEKEKEKLERRKAKVAALKRHVWKISNAYAEIVAEAASRGKDTSNQPQGPTPKEIEFMRLLNSPETFRLSTNLRALQKLDPPPTLQEAQTAFLSTLPPNSQPPHPRSPAEIYSTHSPKILSWLSSLLPNPPTPSVDLQTYLSTADPLCELAVALYPSIPCHLLSKGDEFTIHKIVFFLELCRSVGVRGNLVCRVGDLVLAGKEEDPTRKGGLAVLRCLGGLERVARGLGGGEGRGRGWSLGSVESGNAGNAEAPVEEAVVVNPKRLSARRSQRVSVLGAPKPSLEVTEEEKEGQTGELPPDFKSLPLPEKLKRLSELPPRKARESVYSLYTHNHSHHQQHQGDEDDDHNSSEEYDLLIQSILEREGMEHPSPSPLEVLIEQKRVFKEQMETRTSRIQTLLTEAESHFSLLEKLHAHMHNRNVGVDILMPILDELIHTHDLLVQDLQGALSQVDMEPDPTLGVGVPVGDALLRFSGELDGGHVLARWVVLGLQYPDAFEKFEDGLLEPVKWLKSYVDACKELVELGVSAEEERRCFAKEHRREMNDGMSEEEIGSLVLEKEKRRVVRDARRLQVAAVKMKGVVEGIGASIEL